MEQTWTPVGNLEEARLGTVSSPSSLLTMVQGSVGRLLEGTWTWHMEGNSADTGDSYRVEAVRGPVLVKVEVLALPHGSLSKVCVQYGSYIILSTSVPDQHSFS